jgi:uncharacterized protein YndB with AHSA1/START domain
VEDSGNLKITAVGDREIVITRVFDAPRNLVFRAMTEPELVKRWLLGPPGWSMPICEIDFKVGGKFRYLWRATDGMEMAMNGVYREIVLDERVVNTERFEFGCNSQAGEQTETAVLVEEHGRTTHTSTILYPAKEARDATIASGMAKGIEANYSRLFELLPSMHAVVGSRSTQTA